MSESSEARRKRLKAMLASAQDEDGDGGGGGGLANPLADENGPSTHSGPFTFFRWAVNGEGSLHWCCMGAFAQHSCVGTADAVCSFNPG